MESDCSKSFSVSGFVLCYKNKAIKTIYRSLGIYKSDWDSVGVIIRDKTGPRVLFYSDQEINDLEYGEALTIPFFRDIAVRKLRVIDNEVGSVASEFRAKVVNENLEYGIGFADPAELILKYWKAANILERRVEDISVEKIDSAYPIGLNIQLAAYSEPIIVRTVLSKLDERNY